jgi:NAD dependent epimerase/dehydratase family enzyme
MAEAILLSGSRVFPKKLISAGFTFAHPELELALRSALSKK